MRFNTSITLINETDTLSHSDIKKLHHSIIISSLMQNNLYEVMNTSYKLIHEGITQMEITI